MGKTHKNSGKYDVKDSKNDRAQFKNSKKFKKRDDSDAQLAELLRKDGYEIHYMIGDGNCLFRSVAHQLTGDPNKHLEFRAKVIRYIKKNKEHFSLFLEDDESFSDYVERMEVVGEWGGHLELYALTQCCNVTIVIHQLDTPNYKLPAADPNCKIEIHLSYHGECHYNSVKRFNDLSMGVADWVMTDLDELGSSSGQQSSYSSNGKKKSLSVASVATVSTSRNGKKNTKGVTSVPPAQPVTTNIVTYESVKEDYVLVSVDHESSPISPTPEEVEGAVTSASNPLSVLSTGFEMVCNAIGSLAIGSTTTTTAAAAAAAEDDNTDVESSSGDKKVSTSSGVILTTRSGRPMSKKERRQYEKQMASKTKQGGGGAGVVVVKDIEAVEKASADSSSKKEIIL